MKWQSFTFYMANAKPELIDLQKRVFDHLREPLEQVEDSSSHGQFLTQTMRANLNSLDAVVFFDLDCIPLKPGVVARAVKLAVQKRMVIGCAQQAEYIERNRYYNKRNHWPWILRKANRVRIRICERYGIDPYYFDETLIYAGPCFLVVPTQVYKFVGQPTLEGTERADAAGELTLACRERGLTARCLKPTYCHQLKWKLGNKLAFGIGTVYGNCIFHAFETTYQTNSVSAGLFENYCLRVLNSAILPRFGGHGGCKGERISTHG